MRRRAAKPAAQPPAKPALTPLVEKMRNALLEAEGFNAWEGWRQGIIPAYMGDVDVPVHVYEYDDGEDAFYCYARVIVYTDHIVLEKPYREYSPACVEDINWMVEELMTTVFAMHRMEHVEYP